MHSCFPRALLVAAIAAPLGLSQTNTPWRDEFDTGYSVGQDPTQPSVNGWEQWDLVPNPGAAISADPVQSGPHALFIGGHTDVVQRFAQGTGQWVLGTSVYVPMTGPHALSRDAYFVLLNTYAVQGPKSRSLQLRFEPNSGQVRFIGGPNGGMSMPFLPDQWSDIRVDIDLDTDTARVFYGQPGIALPFGPPFAWSQGAGNNGTSDLQALDLFANDQPLGSNPQGGLYFDDMFVEPLAPPATWNRALMDISFLPAGPGNVEITAKVRIGIANTNAYVDMSSILELFIDGQPGGAPLTLFNVWRETQRCSDKTCGNCHDTPCGTAGDFSVYLDGICTGDDNDDDGCRCHCTSLNQVTFPVMSLTVGASVEVRMSAAAGALPETYLLDDTLNEVYLGPCGGVTYCIPKPGLVCGLPSISAMGIASATATSGFLVSASPAQANKTGILLYSDLGRALVPFNPGGHVLCMPAMGLRRAGPTTTAVGSACTGVFTVDMNAFAHGLWSPPGGGPSHNPAPFLLDPGKIVNCQFWGRDSVTTGSFMSDALEYLVCP